MGETKTSASRADVRARAGNKIEAEAAATTSASVAAGSTSRVNTASDAHPTATASTTFPRDEAALPLIETGSRVDAPKSDQFATLAGRLRYAIHHRETYAHRASLAAGLSRSTVRWILEHPAESPQIATVEAIARALDISPAWLAFRIGDAVPAPSAVLLPALVPQPLASSPPTAPTSTSTNPPPALPLADLARIASHAADLAAFAPEQCGAVVQRLDSALRDVVALHDPRLCDESPGPAHVRLAAALADVVAASMAVVAAPRRDPLAPRDMSVAFDAGRGLLHLASRAVAVAQHDEDHDEAAIAAARAGGAR